MSADGVSSVSASNHFSFDRVCTEWSGLGSSTSQKGAHWRAHSDDQTLRAYGHLLHTLAYAILLTLQGHPSGYQFPLTDTERRAGFRLLNILNGEPGDALVAFHDFVFPFLAGRDDPHTLDHAEYSKWNEVIECFLAIISLKPDGNFKQARDVTQVFAKLEYACRGAVLYEALKNRMNFYNDPYQ
jgi:hypothetical protein